jgi:hypothetical protein
MKQQRISPQLAGIALALASFAAPATALAADGLSVPALDWLWPQVQARITVQTASLTAPALVRPGEHMLTLRGVQGAAVLGDYVMFTRPALGSIRATGGVMLGSYGGAPTSSAGAGSRIGLTLLEGGLAPAGSEAAAVPYLGLGYSSPPLWGAFSLTADVGMVAARPAGAAGMGRAVFGNQAMDQALREMRLAPVLQLGVRYAF